MEHLALTVQIFLKMDRPDLALKVKGSLVACLTCPCLSSCLLVVLVMRAFRFWEFPVISSIRENYYYYYLQWPVDE
jgi:hypothetical protein